MKRSVTVLALLFCAAAASAHPGGHAPGTNALPPHVWTDPDTGRPVRAAYLTSNDVKLRLESETGEIIAWDLTRLAPADLAYVRQRRGAVQAINTKFASLPPSTTRPITAVSAAPASALPFLRFPKLRARWDADYVYVESDGLPDHPMMVGIRAWQQQVPLPQSYSGDNAWRIPLHPVPAAKPVSAKTDLFRGAIALAANGVPIFNPIKNDGKTDTFLAGELDEFGGHSGRADDYHYHLAPLHLQETLGPDLPLAIALDGYPILGLLTDRPCPIAGNNTLDAFNGHAASDGSRYHYHASKTYPYLNGGMHGEVNVRNGGIEPQPRAQPRRQDTRPLRGASITAFRTVSPRSWELTFTLRGSTHTLSYQLNPDNTATFSTTPPVSVSDSPEDRPSRDNPPRRDGPPPRDSPPPREDAGPQGGARPRERAAAGRGGTAPAGEGGPDRAGSTTQPRRPWILVHAPEMDADHDGALTRDELLSEIRRTFTAYDKDTDGNVTREECLRPVRTPLGGFVSQHFPELAGGNAFTLADLEKSIVRMFSRADADGDNTLSPSEINATSR